MLRSLGMHEATSTLPALSLAAAGLLLLCCDRGPRAAPVEPRAIETPLSVAPKLADSPPRPTPAPPTLAVELARELIIVDGHIDLPYRLEMSSEGERLTEDVSERTSAGAFDYPRAREGGLDAAFMAIYVAPRYQGRGARARADRLIDGMEQLALRHPQRFALAASPSDVRRSAAQGKIALALGIENGAALEGQLSALEHFRKRRVSYITLTHIRDNALGDSANGSRRHRGLSAFGKQAVREMNRVGIMVDVSHSSDEAVSDVLAESRVPVIASHSSARHFVPGFARNLSDRLLDALAEHGGVVMVNFGSAFLRPDSHAASDARMREAAAFAARQRLSRANKAHKRRIEAHAAAAAPMVYARVEDVADHIDYIKRRVGIAHVGLGSDFEGVGDTLPRELDDVSKYPNLIRVLLERGYTKSDLEQLCSGNILRVWQAALDYAAGRARPVPD